MEDKNDSTDLLILGIVILAILFYLFSTIWFNQIAGIWYYMKMPVMHLINLLPTSFFKYTYMWVFWDSNFADNIKGATDFILSTNYQDFKDTDTLNSLLAPYELNQKEFIKFYDRLIVTFYSPILIFFMYRFYSKISSKERFSQTYSVATLSEQESKIWTPIKPVIYEFDRMTKGSPYDQKNWWAGAETPLMYLEKHKVIQKFKKEEDDEFEAKQEFLKLDVKKLHNIYIKEIGAPWTGIEDLNFEERCVFAIILPKLFKDNKSTKKLRDIMARYYASVPYKEHTSIIFNKKQIKNIFKLKLNKLDVKRKLKLKKEKKIILKDKAKAKKEIDKTINQILNKHYWKTNKKKLLKSKNGSKEVRKEIQDLTNKHYYKNCIFLTMLLQGRETSGVLAACEMIWVKIENRPFWYILSQAGRTAAFPEVSGLWSHYLAETKVGRRMAAPRVENAILAADKYLFNTHNNYEPFHEFEDE